MSKALSGSSTGDINNMKIGGLYMDFKRITDFMESLEDIGVAGADLGVYLKGREVYRHQIGHADIEAQNPLRKIRCLPYGL